VNFHYYFHSGLVKGSKYRNFDYASVHVAGAERIATIAAQSGVSRLVHVSHLNASHESKSKFYQSKAEGEDRVKAAFPNATIVKPATMYGYEDKLLNNIASKLSLFF
jgi:NADH dehydrogenase (ubiquinone) 1 alpha subcomplex subunit 9